MQESPSAQRINQILLRPKIKGLRFRPIQKSVMKKKFQSMARPPNADSQKRGDVISIQKTVVGHRFHDFRVAGLNHDRLREFLVSFEFFVRMYGHFIGLGFYGLACSVCREPNFSQRRPPAMRLKFELPDFDRHRYLALIHYSRWRSKSGGKPKRDSRQTESQ
jgi:hypothetical protein